MKTLSDPERKEIEELSESLRWAIAARTSSEPIIVATLSHLLADIVIRHPAGFQMVEIYLSWISMFIREDVTAHFSGKQDRTIERGEQTGSAPGSARLEIHGDRPCRCDIPLERTRRP